jgi:formamidopyrimidine-DNA glycosylase
MPELPEVETIKRQLNKRIKGKKIRDVEIKLPKLVKCPLKKFKEAVQGSIIKKISRRAKLLIIELSNGYCLITHLKMAGQLVLNDMPHKHTCLIYHFNDKNRLVFNDLRRFGFVRLIQKKDLADFLKEKKFGPEPLSKKFTLNLFKEILNKRKKAKIKPLLMNQNFLAGIGNLYSDEILFLAKVLPYRKSGTLKDIEIKRIYQAIKKILSLAIIKGGSTSATYLDAEGKKGKYFPLVKVYRRNGKPCFNCGTEIQRIIINGRSAHFCPKCQN